MSTFALKSAQSLTLDEREAWDALQRADRAISSPYFSRGYFNAVCAVRGDARVLVKREFGQPTAFLPLQLGLLGHARPLGGPLSDHHGVVGQMGDRADLVDALSAVGVGVFDYHGALAVQHAFGQGEGDREGSWVVDLSKGYEAWLAQRKKPGGNTLRTILVSERKMIERHGPLEFRFHDTAPDALAALMVWKADQYRESGHFNVFSASWVRGLVQALLNPEEPEGARGVLSTLRVKGQLAAVHFGMMGEGVMHYWFPAYDPAFHKEGSGNALLTQIFKNAKAEGLSEIHLGPGDYRYKAALANWQFPLVEGFAGQGPAALVRRTAHRTEILCEALPLGRLSRWPGKAFRRIDLIAGFRAA